MAELGKPVRISLGFVGVYLVPAEGGCALVDAGMPGQAGRIFAAMAKHGLAPESIRLIFVTNAHADHSGSLKAVAEASGAPVLAHRLEAPYLAAGITPRPRGLTVAGKVLAGLVGPFVKATSGGPRKPDLEVDDVLSLEAFGVKGRAVHTPGHTAGSISLLLDTGEAFVGDLSATSTPLSDRSYVPYFGDSRGTIYASWRRLLDAGATLFYSAHGNTPTPASVLQDELARARRG